MIRWWMLLVCLVALPAEATTYYVRTDGNNGNAGTSNTAGGAWLTITFASDNVAAGDTVRVQAGHYSETPTPSDNGSDGSPITYVADGTVTLCAVTFSSNSYQRWIGFIFDGNAAGCTGDELATASGTSSFMEFWNNTFRDGTTDGFKASTASSTRFNNSIFLGNHFTNLGSMENAIAITIYGDDGIEAYNEFDNINCDSMSIFGRRHRMFNNYAHDMIELTSCHSDFIQFGTQDELGYQYNTFESNFQEGFGGGDEHTAIIQNYDTSRCAVSATCLSRFNIWRRNVIFNIGSGTWGISVGTINPHINNYITHNTHYKTQRNLVDAPRYAGAYMYTGVDWTFVWNNISVEDWTPDITSGSRVVYSIEEGNRVRDYNLAYDIDEPSPNWDSTHWLNPQSNEITQQDPLFTSAAGNDFTLQSGSPARNAGGRLTTVSGSGTGTTFNVQTQYGGYFQGSNSANFPQWPGLVAGDWITVGTDLVQVESVSGDAITVTSSFTFANGDNVYYGDDTTPDIGAYPYKAGGYTLSATYTNAGGTVTVTPNDTSLVRFVVVYEDGIPKCVDNTSPYTCSVGAGTIVARAYPLYASSTLWAEASLASGTQDQRIRIRVRPGDDD